MTSVISIMDNKPVKEYVGSSTYRTNHIEGVTALVPTKGNYQNILIKWLIYYCHLEIIQNLLELPMLD